MKTIITDHELQGPPTVLSSTLINTNLLQPSSPVQTRRDSILKQQGSAKTDKRVSIKQTSNDNNSKLSMSNIEYVSEKSNDTGATSSLGNSKRRQNRAPTGNTFAKTGSMI